MQDNYNDLTVGKINKQATKFALKVIKQYNTEAERDRKVLRTEQAYELQSVMIENGLTLPLDACIVVSKKEIDDKRIKQVIESIIHKNEIFNYYYDKRSQIMLNVMEEKSNREILIYDNVNDSNVVFTIKAVNNLLKKHINKAVWNRELFCVYIVASSTKYYVNFVMSHIIADPGVNNALNILFRKELKGDMECYPQYKDYIDLIRKAPMDNMYSTFLEECLKVNKESAEEMAGHEKKLILRVIESKSNLNSWDCILLENAYEIGKSVFANVQIPELVMKVSCNYRNVLGEKYQGIVGDCHSLFFVSMLKDDSFDSFKERNGQYIDIIRNNAIECGYLSLLGENIYKKVYDTTVININLVTGGFADENAVIQYLESAKTLNDKVLNSKVLRVDAVLYKKKFYMYMME